MQLSNLHVIHHCELMDHVRKVNAAIQCSHGPISYQLYNMYYVDEI